MILITNTKTGRHGSKATKFQLVVMVVLFLKKKVPLKNGSVRI